MRIPFRRRSVVLAVAAVTTMLLTAVPAATSANADVIYTTQYRGVNKAYVDSISGDWAHCNYVTKASYTQHAGCSQGKSVATTISNTFGYSDGEVSDNIGFSVSYTTTVTATNSVDVKPGGEGWFDVGFRIERWHIQMENRTCTHGNCGSWSSPSGVITAQKHIGNTFHYFGTGAS